MLLKLLEELLRGGITESMHAEALLHIPAALTGELRKRFDGTLGLRQSGWYWLIIEDGGGKFSATHLGRLGNKHPFGRELLLLSTREDLCVILTAHIAGGITDEKWSTLLSTGIADFGRSVALIKQTLSEANPEIAYCAESIGGKTEQFRRNYDPVRQTRLLTNLLAELSARMEERSNRSETEAKWLQVVAEVQNAVCWELDQGKLNAALAKSLKAAVGYDFLEVQLVKMSHRKLGTIATFQRNETSYGGALLTMIVRPEVQKDILKHRKPLIIQGQSAGATMMNARLMALMGLRSGVIVPLVNQRRPLGILKLFSRYDDYYPVSDLGRWEEIGRIIAKSQENANLHSVMRRMATVDGLTNVFNHRFFAEQMEREFKRAYRYESELSLLMIDIDFFKNYNDSNGHLQGDYVLAMVAEILRKNVREVDIVCRYGGEEFAVILPETDTEQGSIVADKIRRAVEDHTFRAGLKQPGGKLTISVGVATRASELKDHVELVNRADIALYRAKKLGRNRCEIY